MAHTLSHQDWLLLDGGLQALFASGLALDTYVRRGFEVIERLVPGEFMTFTRAGRGTARGFELVFSTEDSLPLPPLQAFVGLKDQYALWNSDPSVADGRPIFRADYFSLRQFRSLDIYRESYRPVGLDNHCAIPVTMEADVAVYFSVQRLGGVDFTERDRAVLARLQPHLRNARVLAAERSATPGNVDPGCFASLGLTGRETEVFHWLVEGKRNAEIGGILGMREQTVKAHVAAIFGKLGVESRHAAIRLGFIQVRKARDEWAGAEGLCRFRW
jgi:DNA-binding CsgD family transcriptional regulator